MSKLINPFDEHETLAEESPLSPPNLQTDSAEAIVLALALLDPIRWVADVDSHKDALFGNHYPVQLECCLCDGELPDGHHGDCPYWRAVCYRKAKKG